MIQVLLFYAGGGMFGIDLPLVANIRKTEPEEETRRSPVHLAGLLALPDGNGGEASDQVVTLTPDGLDLSLQVDRIGGVANAHEGELLPLPPVFGEAARRFFPRVLLGEAGPVLMLDPAELAAAIYPAPGTDDDEPARTGDAPAASMADLEDRLHRLITSEEMTQQVEAIIHRLSERAAAEARARLQRAVTRMS